MTTSPEPPGAHDRPRTATPHGAATTPRAMAGRAVYARNFGLDEPTTEAVMVHRAGAAYVAEAYEAAGGPGWQGQALTDRDRAVAVVTALVASNVLDERLDVYLRLARRNGLDQAGLEQLMILLTAYLGQPLPSAAMSAVNRSREQPPQTASH